MARPIRPIFDRLVRAAGLYAEGRERAKAVFIDDTYPVGERCSSSPLGPVAAAGQRLVVTSSWSPSDEFATSLPTRTVCIGDRRAATTAGLSPGTRAAVRVRGRDTGSIHVAAAIVSPIAATPRHHGLTGQGVCAGIARGTVRIVRDAGRPTRSSNPATFSSPRSPIRPGRRSSSRSPVSSSRSVHNRATPRSSPANSVSRRSSASPERRPASPTVSSSTSTARPERSPCFDHTKRTRRSVS